MCIAYATKWYGAEVEETPKKKQISNRHKKKIQSGLECCLYYIMGSLTVLCGDFIFFFLLFFYRRRRLKGQTAVCESKSVSLSIKACVNMCFIFFYCFIHNEFTVATAVRTHESFKRRNQLAIDRLTLVQRHDKNCFIFSTFSHFFFSFLFVSGFHFKN